MVDGESGTDEKVNTLEENDLFGEIGLLEGMPSTATVAAAGSARLVRIPAADFLGVVRDTPVLIQRLLERAAGRLAQTHPSYKPVATDTIDVGPLADELHASPRERALLQELATALVDLPTMSAEEKSAIVKRIRALLDA